jgi:hypothetical protein
VAQGSVAIGAGAKSKLGNTAVGDGAQAFVGAGASAYGQNSVAAGTNSAAVGLNTQANAAGSVAIGTDANGNGAISNQKNEFVLGTRHQTYTTPGITKLSRNRQSGPLEVVTQIMATWRRTAGLSSTDWTESETLRTRLAPASPWRSRCKAPT